MTLYLVVGPRRYRDHPPGETFEADLPTDVEARAIGRGSITVVKRSTPSLQPGSFQAPPGWLQQEKEAS